MWRDELRKMKEASGLTTKEISIGANLPEPTLEKIFSGQTVDPKLTTMQQLVHFLGFTLDDLTPESKKKAPAQQELSKEAIDIAIRFDGMDEPGKALVQHVVDYIAPAEQISPAASKLGRTDAEIAAALHRLTDSQSDIPEVQQR